MIEKWQCLLEIIEVNPKARVASGASCFHLPFTGQDSGILQPTVLASKVAGLPGFTIEVRKLRTGASS